MGVGQNYLFDSTLLFSTFGFDQKTSSYGAVDLTFVFCLSHFKVEYTIVVS